MADFAFAFPAALVGQFVFSRALLWPIKPLRESVKGVWAAHAVAYVATTIALAYALAGGGPPAFGGQAIAGLIPFLVWGVIDALRLMRRRAKLRDAVYISRMR